jgi:hypothetical protein
MQSLQWALQGWGISSFNVYVFAKTSRKCLVPIYSPNLEKDPIKDPFLLINCLGFYLNPESLLRSLVC